MGKKKSPPKQAANQSRAVLRMLRISPQKLNLLAQQIRGLPVEKALNQLQFSPKRHAVDVKKALESAIANAENNEGADIDELKVTAAFVNEGPIMKRMRARAKGRGNRILKRISHITVTVGDK